MPLIDLVRRRRSCRAYRRDPVDAADILHMLECARLAPSACNRQPWRFAVVTDAALRAQIVNAGFLPGIAMHWALEAPVHIVLGIERSMITHRMAPWLSRVDYPFVDAGIAGEHLVLAATELGLSTCWIGWLRPRRVRRIVGWPNSIHPVAVVTVGYPQDADTPSRPRRELADFVTWFPTRENAG